MSTESNPYKPTIGIDQGVESPERGRRQHLGPSIYLASAGIVGFFLAVPLIVPRSLSVRDDPNPIGYLIVLLSFPVGGLVYRYRSRCWPIDPTVRSRQLKASFATLLLPACFAFSTGMAGPGLPFTLLSGVVSMVFVVSIFLSGRRRS